MSLTKRSCLRSNTQKRDSFSERIWDDLSEEILQYLSLEDKLRLECVSNQFQRTVFQKQNELFIFTEKAKHYKRCLLFKNNCFDLKSIESVLKKCLFITSIELCYFEENCRYYKNYNQFIQLIIKYCNHLNVFKCPLNEMSVSSFREFQQKFGPKLKTFSCFRHKENLSRYGLFDNLQELKFEKFKKVQNERLAVISKTKFSQLKTLFVYVFPKQELLIKNLIDNFPTLKYLELEFDFFPQKSQKRINSILESVAKLKDLIHLKIDMRFGLNDKLFSDSFKQIANECQKLKSIECNFVVTPKDVPNLRQVMSSLKAFKQLTRLDLRLNFDPSDQDEDPDVNEIFSFEVFPQLLKLTHLKLQMWTTSFGEPQLNVKTLTNIETNLPKLQYLYIYNEVKASKVEALHFIDILSRLSRLQIIEMSLRSDFNEQEIREMIIEKCRKATTIATEPVFD